MTIPLYHLVYQSVVSAPLDESALEHLLCQARTWNTAHGLTGVLLYGDNSIMQVLEGPQAEIQYIFSRIRRDSRHAHVVTLSDGPIQQRIFGQWSMGFRAVNPTDFAHLQGYLNLDKPDYLAATTVGQDANLHAVLADFVAQDHVRF